MTDRITIDVRSEQVLARFRGMEARLRAALLRSVTRLSIEVQGRVKSEKLTGQVLHVRTGTLRRSINRVITDDDSGVMASVGTNVRYAGVHEYGFHGIVNVREHARKVGQTESMVRAHTRQMNMPERSFLRSTLHEMETKIRTDIRAAARSAL